MTDIKLAVMFHQYFIISVSVSINYPFEHSREGITLWRCTLLPLHFVLHSNCSLFRLVFSLPPTMFFVVLPLHVKRLISVLYLLLTLQSHSCPLQMHLLSYTPSALWLQSRSSKSVVPLRIWTLHLKTSLASLWDQRSNSF